MASIVTVLKPHLKALLDSIPSSYKSPEKARVISYLINHIGQINLSNLNNQFNKWDSEIKARSEKWKEIRQLLIKKQYQELISAVLELPTIKKSLESENDLLTEEEIAINAIKDFFYSAPFPILYKQLFLQPEKFRADYQAILNKFLHTLQPTIDENIRIIYAAFRCQSEPTSLESIKYKRWTHFLYTKAALPAGLTH